MKLKNFSFSQAPNLEDFPVDTWNRDQTLILIFGDPKFINRPELFRPFKDAYPSAKILGCSTSGEIFETSILDGSLTGVFVRFEKTELHVTCSQILESDGSFEAGEAIGLDLKRDDLKAIIVFSDGLNVNGSMLVAGLNSVLPKEVKVSGGLAGDADRFQNTWVISDGMPAENYVSAVGFYGDAVSVEHGSRGGWDIFGPERLVTKSEKNVLFELDDKPALELYKNYLGELAAELPASALLFPLALREERDDDKQVVRTILKIDEDAQSMTFAGDIPNGAMVQLMRANFDRLIDGASAAAEMARNDNGGTEGKLSIAISCVGRRLILGERAEEELEAVKESLPVGTTQIGFYSYGEISPHMKGFCDLHNQTMTLTTIGER